MKNAKQGLALSANFLGDKLEIDKIYNMDCLDGMKLLESNSIDLIVTSPPYYNVKEYSHWDTIEKYMDDMKSIFTEVFRCIKNHHYIVVNVGDVVCQVGKTKWDTRRLPLGSMFTTMLENIGFLYIDDFIWDKGEPQSKRNLGNPEYPFYQYPVNCYEHILIFTKSVLDCEKIPCPICDKTIIASNGQTSIGVYSWECKNPECKFKSEAGRGKRFSKRSIMMYEYQKDENYIPKEIVQKWRRDIVKITPVIKINQKGENTIGHSAPFPEEIPEMAIRFYTGVGDIVVDIFSGSGTTAKVAKNLNRHYIGFDTCKEYVEKSNKELNVKQLIKNGMLNF